MIIVRFYLFFLYCSWNHESTVKPGFRACAGSKQIIELNTAVEFNCPSFPGKPIRKAKRKIQILVPYMHLLQAEPVWLAIQIPTEKIAQYIANRLFVDVQISLHEPEPEPQFYL